MSSTTSASAPASLEITVSVGDRPELFPEPEGARHRGPDHGRVGHRHQVDVPRPVGVAVGDVGATASASRVLPTPPGPTAVTSRCRARTSASAARSAARPTNDVSGDGSDGPATSGGRSQSRRPAREAARSASARRSARFSLRSSDETWLSTVRTEMNNRPAIWALREVLAHQGQHLGLAFGDAGVVQQLGLGHGIDRAQSPVRGGSVAGMDLSGHRHRGTDGMSDTIRPTRVVEGNAPPHAERHDAVACIVARVWRTPGRFAAR